MGFREKFGYFMAYWNICFCVVATVLTIIYIIFNREKVPTFGNGVENAIEIVVKSFYIIVAIAVWITVQFQLIRGIKQRDHQYMAPFVILTYIKIFGYLCVGLAVLLLSPYHVYLYSAFMLFFVIQCAIFAPIYSLFRSMRNEVRHKSNRNTDSCKILFL
ncbi:uncharacterized protein [Musca autumnalis]|uniref:uncharacterized protein n=1 Tax=Musca autumnalis TaxID=221902 RepID=UPI003CF01D75